MTYNENGISTALLYDWRYALTLCW